MDNVNNNNEVAEDRESMNDTTANSFSGFELHAVASFRSHGVGQERSSHQAQLRRQATQPTSHTIRRIPGAGLVTIDQESLVIEREMRELTIDTEIDQQRALQVAVVPDRYLSTTETSNTIVRDQETPPRNSYYEGQRLALQGDPGMAPELAQPGSPSHGATGWSVVNTNPGSTPPCARSLHSAAILNGSLYVFGGYNGQARVNDFHAYSFASRRWSPVLAAANSGRPPSPRDRHVSVVHGTSFYVFGGFDGTSRTNDFFGFDLTSMTWREVVPRSGRPPSERHSHASVVYGNSMYVFGGYDGSYK